MFSFVGMGILTFAFTLFNIQQPHPQFMFIGVLVAATVLSAFRFIQTKKKVKQEFMAKSLGEGLR
jgi:hypothetical protein